MRRFVVVAVALATARCAPATPTPAPAVCPSAGPVASVVLAAPPASPDASTGAAPPPDAGPRPTDLPKQAPHESFTLASRVLGEPRHINLYVPPSSVKSATPPTVLYLLDGGDDEDFPHPAVLAAIDLAIRTGEMRPMVVVGIENTERRRDMTGPTRVDKDRSIAPHVEGSAKFRSFIRDELMPDVRKRVGAGGKTAIAGESLAGLFVVETFFLEPALFDTYVAISPSLWWNDQALARGAAAWLLTHPRLANTLYVAQAGDDITEPIAALGAALRAGPPRGLTWYYEPRSDLHHANIYETVAPAVIRKLWPPQPAHSARNGTD